MSPARTRYDGLFASDAARARAQELARAGTAAFRPAPATRARGRRGHVTDPPAKVLAKVVGELGKIRAEYLRERGAP